MSENTISDKTFGKEFYRPVKDDDDDDNFDCNFLLYMKVNKHDAKSCSYDLSYVDTLLWSTHISLLEYRSTFNWILTCIGNGGHYDACVQSLIEM